MKNYYELLERIATDPEFRKSAKNDLENAASDMGFQPDELASYTIKGTSGKNCGSVCGSEMGCESDHGSGISQSCKTQKPGVVECPYSCGVSGTAGLE